MNPHIGEISPIMDMNTKTSEKSPDRGSHAAMVTGAARLVSSGYTGAVGVRSGPGGTRGTVTVVPEFWVPGGQFTPAPGSGPSC